MMINILYESYFGLQKSVYYKKHENSKLIWIVLILVSYAQPLYFEFIFIELKKETKKEQQNP